VAIILAFLWMVAIAIFAGAILIIVNMDRGSASQGGRFYVAIFALAALGWVGSQIKRVWMRSIPYSLSTTPQERWYSLVSLVVLLAAAAILIGLAVLLPLP
jgi:hypothetical protein